MLQFRGWCLGVAFGVLSVGCVEADQQGDLQSASSVEGGSQFFNQALPHTNGRSCGTCHVADDHLALTPAHVNALFASNPNDVLFNRIDADDPNAAVPT